MTCLTHDIERRLLSCTVVKAAVGAATFWTNRTTSWNHPVGLHLDLPRIYEGVQLSPPGAVVPETLEYVTAG